MQEWAVVLIVVGAVGYLAWRWLPAGLRARLGRLDSRLAVTAGGCTGCSSCNGCASGSGEGAASVAPSGEPTQQVIRFQRSPMQTAAATPFPGGSSH